jgi:hypothetical protein
LGSVLVLTQVPLQLVCPGGHLTGPTHSPAVQACPGGHTLKHPCRRCFSPL